MNNAKYVDNAVQYFSGDFSSQCSFYEEADFAKFLNENTNEILNDAQVQKMISELESVIKALSSDGAHSDIDESLAYAEDFIRRHSE